MKTTILFTGLALASSVAANLHFDSWCVDREYEGFQEIAVENPGATVAACTRYRNRNTGNQQWDKCPDCTTSLRGDLRVCTSAGKHIGGDEWNYYCRQVGADYGRAD